MAKISAHLRVSRNFRVLLASVFLSIFMLSALAQETRTARETFTCVDEETKFHSWSRIAGTSSEEKIRKEFPQVAIISRKMADGRKIGGLLFSSTGPLTPPDVKSPPAPLPPVGAVLIIPGNAWRADQYGQYAAAFTAKRLDVFIFDFRGYGLSEGTPTMSAIIDDYREIGAWLGTQYKRSFLYAFSFGGVVALNAFPQGGSFEKIVVDAVPARVTDFHFSCDVSYNPVEKITKPCSYLVVMHGTTDWVVPRKFTQDLIDRAKDCGATLDVGASRGHPFQVEWQSTRRARLKDIIDHFGL